MPNVSNGKTASPFTHRMCIQPDRMFVDCACTLAHWSQTHSYQTFVLAGTYVEWMQWHQSICRGIVSVWRTMTSSEWWDDSHSMTRNGILYVGRLAVAALYEDTHKYCSTMPVKWFQTSSMAVIPSSLEGILQGCRPTAVHSQTSCLKPSFRSQTIKAHLQTSKNIQA